MVVVGRYHKGFLVLHGVAPMRNWVDQHSVVDVCSTMWVRWVYPLGWAREMCSGWQCIVWAARWEGVYLVVVPLGSLFSSLQYVGGIALGRCMHNAPTHCNDNK